MKLDDLVRRANELLELADKAIQTSHRPFSTSSTVYVRAPLHTEFRTASLSFIKNTYDSKHPYYLDFHTTSASSSTHDVEAARGIIKALRDELAGGWVATTKGLVSAEIFSDFIEMSE